LITPMMKSTPSSCATCNLEKELLAARSTSTASHSKKHVLYNSKA